MRRGVILLGLLVSVLFLILINGCGQAAGTVCGDGICDATESCLCADCTNDAKCAQQTTQIKENCDDGNSCTRDTFNTLTKQCEYEVMATCCGNKQCETGERCDEATHTTVCREDCGIQCDGYMEIHKAKEIGDGSDFECGDSRCEEDGPNSFVIRGTSSVKTTVENIGERVMSPVTSSFTCRRDGRRVVSSEGQSHSGVTFTDSFDGANSIDVRGQYTGDNEATYSMKFEIGEIQLVNFDCTITINSPENTITQDIDIAVRQ